MAKTDFTAQQLRELLNYDGDTGVFTRLVRVGSRGNAGDVAGSNSRGYLTIGVLGRNYRVHRLAWLYVHGVWPAGHIDHIDGNPGNNAIVNLRDVSRNVNMQNMRQAKSSSGHGFLGVTRHGKRWKAQITVDCNARHIGTFDTPKLAHAAYLEAKRRLHEGCTI